MDRIYSKISYGEDVVRQLHILTVLPLYTVHIPWSITLCSLSRAAYILTKDVLRPMIFGMYIKWQLLGFKLEHFDIIFTYLVCRDICEVTIFKKLISVPWKTVTTLHIPKYYMHS